VVMNPLGGGVIPAHPELFGFIKSHEGQSVADAALRFLLGQREVSVVLPGMSTVREAEENCAAAEDVAPVTAETLDALRANLSRELDTLCTGCAYCDKCPQGLDPVKWMDVYNEYVLSGGSKEAVRVRMNEHWSISPDVLRDCNQCGQCESLCTQKLPIIERLALLSKL